MIVFPPAKVNLGLHITEKRKDGFHNLETIFYHVGWCDVLEIVKADDFKIFQTGLPVTGNEKDNLCVKSYDLLKADFNLSPVHIHLHKIIPMGAGLGGGSSDASHTLLLLNKIFKLNLSTPQLKIYAEKLGSDCAFFLSHEPMLATGRGEILSPVQINLKGYYIVIVMPPVQVSTADAYKWITPNYPSVGLAHIITQPIASWKQNLINDFEAPVFIRFPQIKDIKQKLISMGAVYAAMSGSGASVFGIFEKEVNVNRNFKDCIVWRGKA